MASVFLLLGDGLRVKLIPWLISYAVGTLLGVALLALVPEALEVLKPTRVMAPAAEQVAEVTGRPVLTTPDSAVLKLKGMLAASRT